MSRILLLPHGAQAGNHGQSIRDIVFILTKNTVGVGFQFRDRTDIDRHPAKDISERPLGAFQAVVRLGVDIEVVEACHPATAIGLAVEAQFLGKAAGVYPCVVRQLVHWRSRRR